MNRIRVAGLVVMLLAGATACSLPKQKPVPLGAPELGTYAKDEIRTQAETLLETFGVGRDLGARILARLDELLADPGFAPKIDNPGVNGVGVFQVGSGGAMIGGGAGSGIVSFAEGDQDVKFEVSGFTVGASAGGENTYGALLLVGLNYEEKFPDRYQTRGTGGTIGETSYKVGRGRPERGVHTLHYVGSGVGFGATASGAHVTIELSE